jgi:hypothetical protein
MPEPTSFEELLANLAHVATAGAAADEAAFAQLVAAWRHRPPLPGPPLPTGDTAPR